MLPLQIANAQRIIVDDTTLNIPITVIIPITLQIQNAQVCASVASSRDQICQQIVLQPTLPSYIPVDIYCDLLYRVESNAEHNIQDF